MLTLKLHVIVKCPVYNNVRSTLYDKIGHMNVDFENYDDIQKFTYLFCNDNIIKYSAKASQEILLPRGNTQYKYF